MPYSVIVFNTIYQFNNISWIKNVFLSNMEPLIQVKMVCYDMSLGFLNTLFLMRIHKVFFFCVCVLGQGRGNNFCQKQTAK